MNFYKHTFIGKTVERSHIYNDDSLGDFYFLCCDHFLEFSEMSTKALF